MHHLQMYPKGQRQCVNSAHVCKAWNLRPRAVRQVTGALPVKLEATTAGILLAGVVLVASEADAQGAWQPAPLDTVVAPASQQVQPLPQLPSAPPAAAATGASPRPFDVVLLSVVRVTDDLSNAADSLLELMELTAAADSTLAGDAADLLSLSNNESSVSSSSQAAGAVQLTPVLHSSTAPSAPALADAGGSLQLPAADRQIGASTAQRMSQQWLALTVAAEALRLATLLEGQQDGCDPAEQELLQQVAAAARLVSILAADIVQPAEQAGGDFTLSTSSSSPASAVAAESTAGAADVGSGISRTELHSFARLPALGLLVSDSSCGMPAEPVAALPTQCLRL